MSSSLNWKQLTAVQAGGVFSLPMLLVGHYLCEHHGTLQSVKVIFLGNSLLLALAFGMVSLAVQRPLNTLAWAKMYFTEWGTRLAGLSLMFAMLGWYSLQLKEVSHTLVKFIPEQSSWIFKEPKVMICLLSTASLVSVFYGIKGFVKISYFTAIGLLLCLFVSPDSDAVVSSLKAGSSVEALALVLTAGILGVCDLPSFYRYSASLRDSKLSVLIVFLLCIPVAQLCGVFMGSKLHLFALEENITQGNLFNLMLIFWLVMACWSSNNLNLYSAVQCYKTLNPQSRKQSIGLLALLATIAALLLNFEKMPDYLDTLAVGVSSMAAVILLQFALNKNKLFIVNRKIQGNNTGAFLFGIAVSLAMTASIPDLSAKGVFISALAATLFKLYFFAKERTCRLPDKT
jgi:cytosine permease